MIRILENVRAGIVDPLTLKRLEATRRSYSLRLSQHRDVEMVHTGGINTMDIDPAEGKFLLSGCADGTINIHGLQMSPPNYSSPAICRVDKNNMDAHKYSVECVQWYPHDTGMFVTSGMDKCMKIWDTNLMIPVEQFHFESRVFRHDISESCIVAVVSSSKQVQLVDLRSGSFTHELRGHSDSVLVCKWSAHQECILASGSCDNRVIIWDIRSAKNCLLALDQNNRQNRNPLGTAHDGSINGLTFTSDGLFLLTFGTDNKLKLWSTLTGLGQMVNYGKIANNSKNKQIAITVDADPKLVYIPSGGSILVFEVHTGFKVDTLVGHCNNVNTCVYHRHFHELYSGGNDRNVLIWSSDESNVDSKPEELPKHSTKVLGQSVPAPCRNVTADAWSSDDD